MDIKQQIKSVTDRLRKKPTESYPLSYGRNDIWEVYHIKTDSYKCAGNTAIHNRTYSLVQRLEKANEFGNRLVYATLMDTMERRNNHIYTMETGERVPGPLILGDRFIFPIEEGVGYQGFKLITKDERAGRIAAVPAQ